MDGVPVAGCNRGVVIISMKVYDVGLSLATADTKFDPDVVLRKGNGLPDTPEYGWLLVFN